MLAVPSGIDVQDLGHHTSLTPCSGLNNPAISQSRLIPVTPLFHTEVVVISHACGFRFMSPPPFVTVSACG